MKVGDGSQRLTLGGDILKEAVRQLGDRLPSGWVVQVSLEPDRPSSDRPDAVLSVTAPPGEVATFVVEVKASIVPRDLPYLLDKLAYPREAREAGARPLIVARYLSPSTREQLSQRGASYADATGNVRLESTRPAMFVRDVGAPKDPWRGPGRPKGSLRGGAAARVVRAIVDFQPPMSVPKLAELAGTSMGTTYRVVQYLEDENLLRRHDRVIEDVAWRGILQRWSAEYGFSTTNAVVGFLQPRGLDTLMRNLAEARFRYAVSGSLSAAKWATYAPSKLAMVYVDDVEAAARTLGLRPVDRGVNVLLASAAYPVVFERTETMNGTTVAAPSQTVVDLMGGPGRNPAEAEALMDWMETHVDQWRR